MNMYYYNGTYSNVCTQVRTTVCGRGGRGLRGPVGVGWWRVTVLRDEHIEAAIGTER